MTDPAIPLLQVLEHLRAAFPELSMRLDRESVHVEASVEIPAQPGLDFAVHLDLQNHDELHLSVGGFWCSWFPASNATVVAAYRDAVCGVLSGRNRIVEYRRRGTAVGAALQAPTADGWKTVAQSSRSFLPCRWLSREHALQNGSAAR